MRVAFFSILYTKGVTDWLIVYSARRQDTRREELCESQLLLLRSDRTDYRVRVNLQGFYDFNEIEYRDIPFSSLNLRIVRTGKMANDWKDARKREIDGTYAKIRRMSRSIDIVDLVKDVSLVEEKKNDINWNKPSLESLSEVLSRMDSLSNELRGELIRKLQSEDAISILEEPDIIEDLGEQKGWDFERFIRALEVVLRNGIIEIKAEEKT